MQFFSGIRQQLDPADDDFRRARLRTMQRMAGGLLLLAIGVFCLARSLRGLHPAWG